MSRFHSHLNSAVTLLGGYNGAEPFASFLKKYFAQHKKFGSRDRKQVGHLCYCYFRMGKMMSDMPIEERIMAGLFLCSEESNEILRVIRPEWDEQVDLDIEGKCSMIGAENAIASVFPWKEELSEEIDHKEFCASSFIQPALFLRIRPGKETIVRQKLGKAGIPFETVSETCLALSNASRVDTVIELDQEAVVQDLSSQRVGELLQLARQSPPDQLRVWDCCAASGGKSILAKDILGDIELFVSDVRESILINLEDRFERAGLDNYERFVADLSKPVGIFLPSFNLVIADVPCTGSGTWGRTPEQLYYFDPAKIGHYAALQRQIIQTIIPQVEPGGYLLFITCSVFKKENEEQVAFIKEKFHLQLVKMEYFKGYDQKADTLFAALLQKPL
jgi:16S rRNA (cytosine967-C5)-methyltransferase